LRKIITFSHTQIHAGPGYDLVNCIRYWSRTLGCAQQEMLKRTPDLYNVQRKCEDK